MIPAFLASRFDLESLDADASTFVAIDRNHAICWFNAAWSRFAVTNDGADVLAHFRRGASYLQGIAQPCRSFYEAAFLNALETGDVFEQDYECSSPEVFRTFRLRAMPCDGEGLLLQHNLVVESPQTRVASELPASAYERANGVILQCSNCRTVRRADGSAWDWVPAWVARSPARASHGLCNPCLGFYWRIK